MDADQWLILQPYTAATSNDERKRARLLARAHTARLNHARKRIEQKKLTSLVEEMEVTLVEDEEKQTTAIENLEKFTQYELVTSHSPRAIVDNARQEPFQVWSVQLQENEHQLVDTYINMFQRRFYGSRPADGDFNWFRDIVFPKAAQNPVVFRCGVLGVAAILRARFQPHDVETLSQDVQSLEILQKHFRVFPEDCSDDAIMMCVFRALFEDFHGKYVSSWTHMLAAIRLIRKRGGPEALRNNETLAIIFNCYHYRTRGYVAGSLLRPQSVAHNRMAASDDKSTFTSDTVDVTLAYEELVDILRKAEKLAVMTERNHEHDANAHPYRYKMFQSGSNFHLAMRAPYDVVGAYPSLQNRSTFGMSALLHLNLALLDYADNPELTEWYLQDLCTRMRDVHLERYISCDSLAQFLMVPSRNPVLDYAQYDRLWKVGRLLNLVKRASASAWHQLWTNLSGYLTLQRAEVTAMDAFEPLLKQDILNAPPTKYIMALLKDATQSMHSFDGRNVF